MKKSIFFVLAAALLTCSSAFAQTGSTQTDVTPKKLSYNFIMEFGNYFGSKTVGLTGVAINSLSIKDQNLIGIGVGYEMDVNDQTAIPLFFNFRHYFQRPERKVTPLVNLAVGTRLCFNEIYDWIEVYDPITGYYNGYEDRHMEFTPGLYASMTAGFKAKSFSFTSGFFCKSDSQGFASGIEVKVGFTF